MTVFETGSTGPIFLPRPGATPAAASGGRHRKPTGRSGGYRDDDEPSIGRDIAIGLVIYAVLIVLLVLAFS